MAAKDTEIGTWSDWSVAVHATPWIEDPSPITSTTDGDFPTGEAPPSPPTGFLLSLIFVERFSVSPSGEKIHLRKSHFYFKLRLKMCQEKIFTTVFIFMIRFAASCESGDNMKKVQILPSTGSFL